MSPTGPSAGPAESVAVEPLPRGPLAPADGVQLAELHAQALPDSLVVRLGLGYTRTFYRYLARSERELVFVARDGDRVVGACVLSLEPETLTRRLALRTPLLPAAALAALRTDLVRSLLGSPRETSGRPDAIPDDLPEILLIFTSPAIRSRGLGARLLAACERSLAGRGRGRYLVRTVDDPENAALRFYERNGFAPIGRSRQHGRWYRVFQKETAGSSPGGRAR